MLQAVHGQDLPARDENKVAQEQSVAETQMRKRMAEDVASRGKAGAEGRGLGNVGSVHGANLCSVGRRLARITITPPLSAFDAALR